MDSEQNSSLSEKGRRRRERNESKMKQRDSNYVAGHKINIDCCSASPQLWTRERCGQTGRKYIFKLQTSFEWILDTLHSTMCVVQQSFALRGSSQYVSHRVNYLCKEFVRQSVGQIRGYCILLLLLIECVHTPSQALYIL